MRTLIKFLAFICVFSSCEKVKNDPLDVTSTKEDIVENHIPFTTLSELSPGFSFVIPSLVTVGSSTVEYPTSPKNFPYMAIINDQETYLREVHSKQTRPTIDYSTHTLLAIGLETRGVVKISPVRDGDKTILKVYEEISKIGPQGVVPHFFSVIISRAESENVRMEVKIINVD